MGSYLLVGRDAGVGGEGADQLTLFQPGGQIIPPSPPPHAKEPLFCCEMMQKTSSF